jgi:hypothetical protein
MSPTEATGVAKAFEPNAVTAQPKIQPAASVPSVTKPSIPNLSPVGPRRVGYGMPCAKCTTYYAANLAACPVCQATERVAAVAPLRANTAAAPSAIPDPAALEEERERFLREFKSQAYAASLQLGPTAAPFCTREENHRGTSEAATICQGCHDQLQERVDVLEAVLHMDIKEAAEVIYDAVWSDPSDPSKTYQNAAQAILSELRKRSGITPVFGPLQPLPH